jgi:hypothetical protein
VVNKKLKMFLSIVMPAEAGIQHAYIGACAFSVPGDDFYDLSAS